MGLISRLKSLIVRGEGDVRPGPYFLPYSGGTLSAEAGQYWNWWQMGYDITGMSRSAMVEACISAYAQTVAMCPGDHWWLNEDGGRERVTTSALARILKSPNAYETISDFLLNAVDHLYSDGNAYALALRNNRYEIQELHLMNPRMCEAHVAINGEVFYSLAGNEVIDYQLKQFPLLVPARDVLHLRLRTGSKMLRGESPIVSAARDIAAGNAMAEQQINFYVNQARPSIVLTTDMTLDAGQLQVVRDAWDAQAKKLNAGGVPILTSGIKPVPLSTNANDSQLAEILKMSEQHIALAYRVPLQMLGLTGTPAGSTEALMQGWLNGGFGFCISHVEEGFDSLFGLKGYPDEYTEFNTDALLRSSMKDRVEAFARGVQGTIFAPNEAREAFGLKRMPDGDEPRAQQQLVPLSAAAAIPAAPPAPSPPAAPPAPANGKGITNAERARVRRRFRASHSRSLEL